MVTRRAETNSCDVDGECIERPQREEEQGRELPGDHGGDKTLTAEGGGGRWNNNVECTNVASTPQ